MSRKKYTKANTPGFYAEASLAEVSDNYAATMTNRQEPAAVVPQFLTWCWVCRYRYGCGWVRCLSGPLPQ